MSRQVELATAVTATEEMTDLRVAAGVLQNSSGKVLVTQRPAGGHMGGAWEFPGGKIHMDETPLQGLVRELAEELAIDIRYVRQLTRYAHNYPEHRVQLYVWKVLIWHGEPKGAEGQPLRWLAPAVLMQEGLLPADQKIVTALQQPAAVNSLAACMRRRGL